MKKNIRICFIAITFMMIVVFSYMYMTSEQHKRRESIRVIKDVFGLDISEQQFTYKNTLYPLKEGGELQAQVFLDENTAEIWKEKLEKWNLQQNLQQHSYLEFLATAMRLTGFKWDEINGDAYGIPTLGPARILLLKINGNFRHKQGVYFHNNKDNSITAYFEYEENELEHDTYRLNRNIVLFLLAFLFVCFIIGYGTKNRLLHRKWTICIIKNEFEINITKMKFHYKNTLNFLKSEGSVAVKCEIDEKMLQQLYRQYDLKWLYGASYETACRTLADEFETEAESIKGKIVAIHRNKDKSGLQDSGGKCLRLL